VEEFGLLLHGGLESVALSLDQLLLLVDLIHLLVLVSDLVVHSLLLVHWL
jgi:hypothetical protein